MPFLPPAGYAAAQAEAVAEAISDALTCGCKTGDATVTALANAIAEAGGCGKVATALAGKSSVLFSVQSRGLLWRQCSHRTIACHAMPVEH